MMQRLVTPLVPREAVGSAVETMLSAIKVGNFLPEVAPFRVEVVSFQRLPIETSS